MWLFPNVEDRDIAMQETKNNNSGPLGGKDPSNVVPTGTLCGKDPNNVAPTRTFGGKNLTNVVPTTLPSGQLLQPQHEIDIARYTDAMGISQKDYIPSPSPVSVGQSAQLQLKDTLLIPPLIDLEKSGLQRSPRIAAFNGPHDVPDIATYSTSPMPSSSRRTTRTMPRLSFLSVFTSVGYLWTFATTNSYAVDEQFSFVAQFSNNFDQLNGLFDDTINEICHQIHAYTISNESFTYLQTLRQEDFKHFFQAMEVELNNHETCKHWNLMERKDLPPGTKTIMAILSFKCKCFPD
jgi:hypothetical protein